MAALLDAQTYNKKMAPANTTVETINPTVEVNGQSGTVSHLSYSGKGQLNAVFKMEDGSTRSMSVDEAVESGSLPRDVATLIHTAAGQGRHAPGIFKLYKPGQEVGRYVAAMDEAINLMAANISNRQAFDSSPSPNISQSRRKNLPGLRDSGCAMPGRTGQPVRRPSWTGGNRMPGLRPVKLNTQSGTM